MGLGFFHKCQSSSIPNVADVRWCWCELPSSVCFLNSGAAVGKISCTNTVAKVSSKFTFSSPIFLLETSVLVPSRSTLIREVQDLNVNRHSEAEQRLKILQNRPFFPTCASCVRVFSKGILGLSEIFRNDGFHLQVCLGNSGPAFPTWKSLSKKCVCRRSKRSFSSFTRLRSLEVYLRFPDCDSKAWLVCVEAPLIYLYLCHYIHMYIIYIYIYTHTHTYIYICVCVCGKN